MNIMMALGDDLLFLVVLRMMIERQIYVKGIFKITYSKDMADVYTAMEVTLKVFTWMIRDQKVQNMKMKERLNAHIKMADSTGQ